MYYILDLHLILYTNMIILIASKISNVKIERRRQDNGKLYKVLIKYHLSLFID